MDAISPKSAHEPASPAELLSRHVRVDELEWQKTRFPGCEAKTLLFDRESGLVTALMRFAPGAVLPDHEHVKIEQTRRQPRGPGRPRRRPHRVQG